jgi:hypothetical protein
MILLGIDLGLDGGLAFFDGDCVPVHLCNMPIRFDPHGKKDIYVIEMKKIITEVLQMQSEPFITLACLEWVHSFGNERRSSIFSFGRGTGKVQALLELMDIKRIEVLPTKWKDEILFGTDKTKEAAIGYSIGRWPQVETVMRKTNKKLSYYDGMADALCLGEYAFKYLNGGL